MIDHAFKALQIKARQEVYTYLSGNHLSKLLGEGYDFSTLLEYQLGDDIRRIDWIASAKLQKPYVKHFSTNRELSIVVASLMDSSLYFGQSNDKQHMLTHVATLLAYASLEDNNLFMGINYTESNIYTTPPTKQIYHVNQFSKNLYDSNLLETSLDYQASINNLFTRISKPSLLFVIGDFLEEVDLSLLAQKHEVIAIIIRDKDEEKAQALGEVNLLNPKNNHSMHKNISKKEINKYLAKLKAHDQQILMHFEEYKIRYIKICTDEEAIGKLVTLFH